MSKIVLIILGIVIACRYSPSFPSPETAPDDEAQPTTSSIPAVAFTRATAAPTQTPAGQDRNSEVTAQDRGFEDGLPLAARVNNQPLFLNTLERQVRQYEQALLNGGVDLTSDEGQILFSQTQKQVFESLLDQLIIEQKAIDLGIFISDEEVEAKIQETISQMPADMRFEDWLVENDLTYQEFFAISQAQLIAGQVFERITRNIPEVADQVQLKYIRVENSDSARVVIEKILTGTSFTALYQDEATGEAATVRPARESSWFPKGTGLIPLQVEAIAFSLKSGELSGPIETPDGYYIIKLEAREANRPISSDMIRQLKKQIFENWLLEQRSSTVIERFVVL